MIESKQNSRADYQGLLVIISQTDRLPAERAYCYKLLSQHFGIKE